MEIIFHAFHSLLITVNQVKELLKFLFNEFVHIQDVSNNLPFMSKDNDLMTTMQYLRSDAEISFVKERKW